MNIIKNFTKEITEKDGIFFAKTNDEISYPKEGNERCFQIEEDSFWFKHRNNCIINVVKKYSPDKVFFDIGGGNGFVSKGFEANGISTILVEPGIEGCLNAKKRGISNILCSTLQDASFKHSSIPSIGLFDVLEHINDDLTFLESINKFLIPGGFVYLTVPAHNILWSNEDPNAGHYRRYNLKRLKKLFNESGFKIEYSTYFFSILPIPIFLFRTIPSFLKLNKKSRDYNKNQKEHTPKKGLINNILNKIWSFELRKIQNGRKVPFGGSCLVVAKKIE
jgi:SAM-dependent methyltransferase